MENMNNMEFNEDGGGGDFVETPNKQTKHIQDGNQDSRERRSLSKIPTPIYQNKLQSDNYTKKRVQFCTRKSISMLDMQRSRGNQQKCYAAVHRQLITETDTLMMVNCIDFKKEPMNELIAKFKIIIALVLNVYRRRKDDVKKYKEEIEKNIFNNNKYKNQVHVLNTVYRNEQKFNANLRNENKQLKNQIDGLSLELAHLKTKNSTFFSEIQLNLKEIEKINQSTINLQKQLANSKETVSELEGQLNSSINQSFDLEMENVGHKEQIDNLYYKNETMNNEYLEKCIQHDVIVNNYKNQLNTLEMKLIQMKTFEEQIQEYQRIDISQREIIRTLTCELYRLKYDISTSFSTRISNVFFNISRNSLFYLGTFAHTLLPFYPSPRKLSIKNGTDVEGKDKLNKIPDSL